MVKGVKWDTLDKLTSLSGSLWGPISTNIPNVSLWARPKSSDGTRILGLTIRGQKRVSGGNVGPTGFICVCGPGLVSKSLLHRVDIKPCTVDIIGLPLWGNDTPHCGTSTGIYVREPIAWE